MKLNNKIFGYVFVGTLVFATLNFSDLSCCEWFSEFFVNRKLEDSTLGSPFFSKEIRLPVNGKMYKILVRFFSNDSDQEKCILKVVIFTNNSITDTFQRPVAKQKAMNEWSRGEFWESSVNNINDIEAFSDDLFFKLGQNL